MDEPLVNADYLLEKIPGKGGWTYAAIPEIPQNKGNPFGWVKVKGRIDDYPLSQYKLMPMGEGRLFLPVKAAIRKLIGKEAGDKVHIVLYLDESPFEIPEELRLCFENEPPALYQSFKRFSEGDQKAYVDWIFSARKEETRALRIMKMMKRVAKQLPLRTSNREE